MGLFEQIRIDAAVFAGNANDFGVPIVFENTDSPSVSAEVTGIFSRHHISVNRHGVAFNNRTAHVTVSKTAFADVDYTILNAAGEIDFKDHRVTVDGITYIVNEWFPGDTTKLITIILGDFNGD